MHRIDDPTAVPTLPAPRAQGTPGYFTGGSPGSSGFAATVVRYEFMNALQEEISHVIESSGITLNKTDNTQLTQAISARVPSGSNTPPAMNSTAAAGTALTFSRGDHVHPSDTSRLPLTGGTLSGLLTINAGVRSPTGSSNNFGILNNLPGTNAVISVENPNGVGLEVMTSAAGSSNCALFRVDRTDNTFATFLYGSNTNNVGSITTNGSGVSYNTTSDYRLKRVHGEIGGQRVGAMIDGVPVYDAEYTDHPENRWPMFLAHELAEQCPWAVTGEKDGERDIGILTGVDDQAQEAVTLATDVAEPGELGEGHRWEKTGRIMVPQQVDATKLVAVLWAEVQNLRRRIAALEQAPT